MTWRSNKGKSRLIRELMAKGISVRKAEKAVNAVFDCMARAVRRGEDAEIPGGRIQAKMRKGQPRRKWQRFVNVHTGKITFKMVSFRGRRRVIQFKPEQAEARQLAAELLGRRAIRRPWPSSNEPSRFIRINPGRCCAACVN